MKNIFIIFGIIMFFSFSRSTLAFNVNINVEILDKQDFTTNTNWITIDLTEYRPWEFGIRSLYVEMRTHLYADCPPAVGVETMSFEIRPFNENSNIRSQISSTSDIISGDVFTLYVWVPINESNKIQYGVTGFDCDGSKANVRLRVKGYSF